MRWSPFRFILATLLLAFGLAAAVGSARADLAGQAAYDFVTSTPGEDGSIIHIVQQDESLASISQAYGISMADIRSLNGMAGNSLLIFPGQKLIIRPPQPPTATPTLTATVPRPTRTPTVMVPTRTPRPTRTETATPLPSITPDPIKAAASNFWDANQFYMLYAMIAVCAVGLLWTLWAGFRKSS